MRITSTHRRFAGVTAAIAVLTGCMPTARPTPPEPVRLWQKPLEAASTTADDEGAPKPRPGPPPKSEPTGTAIKVGIGSVLNETDGTTESFGLLQHFREHPITPKRGRVSVRLVDHPMEADWAVSGRVEGTVRHRAHDVRGAASAAGAFMFGFGLAGMVPIGIAAGAGGMSADSRDKALFGVGALATTGLVTLLVAEYAAPNHAYEWDERGSFVIRKGGARVATFDVGAKGGVLTRGELQGVHDTALRAIWEGLGAKLASEIDREGGGS